MQALIFEEVLEKIVLKDSRYKPEAYLFVREALDYIQKPTPKERTPELRHVTGQELLEGIRKYGLSQYGPMTASVLEEWGVRRCEDFGAIVFNMIEFGLLCKTAEDSPADFGNGYDFEQAFRKPFQPGQTKTAPTRRRTEKSTQI